MSLLPREPLREVDWDLCYRDHDEPLTRADVLSMVDDIRKLAHEREPYREFAPWAWFIRSVCDAILDDADVLIAAKPEPTEESE